MELWELTGLYIYFGSNWAPGAFTLFFSSLTLRQLMVLVRSFSPVDQPVPRVNEVMVVPPPCCSHDMIHDMNMNMIYEYEYDL